MALGRIDASFELYRANDLYLGFVLQLLIVYLTFDRAGFAATSWADSAW